jgi:hypothetical protein
LDESWLDGRPDYESIGLPPGQKGPEGPRVTGQRKNMMVMFNHVKRHLRRQLFEMADQLVLPIDASLRGIEKRTLHAAFLDLTPRLCKFVQANGNYFKGV